MASSQHPVATGGYSRADFPSLAALTAQARANINPLSDAMERAYPGLSRWRTGLTARTYNHASEPKAPSFFAVLTQAPPALVDVLPGLSDEAQAVLYRPGTASADRGPNTLLDATGLVEQIKSGTVTASQVVEASIARTAVAQEVLGAYTELLADQARGRAKELDAKQTRGEPLGALHGLPISIKGHIALKGTLSTRCYVVDTIRASEVPDPSAPGAELLTTSLVGDPAPAHDALTVQALLEAGAIVVAKTTMPTTIMQLDTRSPAFGQTLNAHNLALSPGGSSGGEAASVASGSSALGLGSDIGGSVRQPAAMSGLWGLRPSALRIPMVGSRSPLPGNLGVDSVWGPLARSLRDVRLFMRTVLAPDALDGSAAVWDRDGSVQPRLWAEGDGDGAGSDSRTFVPSWLTPAGRHQRLVCGHRSKLVIGVERDDAVVVPQPPIRRALQHVVDRLKAFAQSEQGRGWLEIKELPGPLGDHKVGWDLIRSLYWHDGAVKTRALLAAGQEALDPLTAFILQEPYVPAQPASASEVFDLRAQREAYKAQYWAAWDQAGIDILLCPATTSVAQRPESAYYWGYTSQWNLLDYPSLSFPSGVTADAELDHAFVEAERQAGRARGPYDAEDAQVAGEYAQYCHAFDGVPVGLQLVGKRDEQLIRAAEVVEHAAL